MIIPNEAEHERRLIRQAREAGGGGQMPAEAMLEMKGQMETIKIYFVHFSISNYGINRVFHTF